MKKVILSLSALAFVGVITAGATLAVWSDSEEITGNTLGAGVINLTLVDGSNTDVLKKPIYTAVNMFPGQWSSWHHVGLKNDSTGEGKMYMYVTNVQGQNGICANTNLEMEVHGDSFQTYDEKWALYNGPLMDIEGEGNRINLTGDLDKVAGTNKDSVFYPTIKENWVLVVHQRAGLNEDAPNSVQGEECTWDEVFVLESAVPTN